MVKARIIFLIVFSLLSIGKTVDYLYRKRQTFHQHNLRLEESQAGGNC